MAGAVLLALVLLSCWALVGTAAVASTSGFPVPSYYVMGDASVDAGNNNFIKSRAPHANFKPYGMTSFKGVPTGRFCDGRILPDLLAVIMKLPQAPPSRATLTIAQKAQVNFASGGSAILQNSSTAMGFNNAITFESQMTAFETFGTDIIFAAGVDEALLILNDAIYHMSFGATDIVAYFTKPAYAASVGTITDFVKKLAAEYLYYVNRVYGGGARKVVIFGVGPLHKSPLVKLLASGMTAQASRALCTSVDRAVRMLNKELQNVVAFINSDNDLGMEHESLMLVFCDVYEAVLDITNLPATHGFTDVKNACCGGGKFGAEIACGSRGHKVCASPRTALYWNDLQFTEAGHKRLFKLFFDGSRFVRPFSVKHLAKLLIPGVPY